MSVFACKNVHGTRIMAFWNTPSEPIEPILVLFSYLICIANIARNDNDILSTASAWNSYECYDVEWDLCFNNANVLKKNIPHV